MQADRTTRAEPDWGVLRCPCGQLYLKIGPVRLEFSPEEFHRLHVLVREAVAQFGAAASEPSTPHVQETTH